MAAAALPVRSKTEWVDKYFAVDVNEGLEGWHVHLAKDVTELIVFIFKDFNVLRIFLKYNLS